MPNKDSLKTTSCCSCSSGCCGSAESTPAAKRSITIDFMYLDLSVCSWCQGTEQSLEDALAEVAAVLSATGVEVTVNKIHVTSAEQAWQLRFASSPTIRVNGRDIQMEIKESLCDSCGDLCGGEVDCRVWVYQGKDYTVPPKAMIIEAVLREVYGGGSDSSQDSDEHFVLPDNLKHFFQIMQQKIQK